MPWGGRHGDGRVYNVELGLTCPRRHCVMVPYSCAFKNVRFISACWEEGRFSRFRFNAELAPPASVDTEAFGLLKFSAFSMVPIYSRSEVGSSCLCILAALNCIHCRAMVVYVAANRGLQWVEFHLSRSLAASAKNWFA